jgi:hypothetical protein
VVELVDAPDSKSGTARCVGSSPTGGTILYVVFHYAADVNPIWKTVELGVIAARVKTVTICRGRANLAASGEFPMKAIAIAASLALAATGAASSAGAVGCISGAVVGGVGAHYARPWRRPSFAQPSSA